MKKRKFCKCPEKQRDAIVRVRDGGYANYCRKCGCMVKGTYRSYAGERYSGLGYFLVPDYNPGNHHILEEWEHN